MTIVTDPTKMDDITVKKLEEAFLLDCTVEEACFVANISKQTYYNWIKSFPELEERFDALRNNPVYLARATVIEKIQEDGKLAMDYLARKKKKEFSPKIEIDADVKTNVVGFNLILDGDNTDNQADEEASVGMEETAR